MSTLKRDSFIFYRSFFEAIGDLPDDQQLQVYKAIASYSLNLKEPEITGISGTIFKLIKPQLDANIKRFENGSKPKNKQAEREQKAKQKRNRSETEAKTEQVEIKVEANNNNNVNDNDNVNVNLNENKNLNDNIKDIIAYLNLKANTNYKASSEKTRSLIKARINEGFTLEDFKTVIDKKIMLWGKDLKMSAYLRPETLFGNKFEGYLNEIISNAKILVSKGIFTEKTAKNLDSMEEWLND